MDLKYYNWCAREEGVNHCFCDFDKNEIQTTITSDFKFKINFSGQIFLRHNTAMEVSSL